MTEPLVPGQFASGTMSAGDGAAAPPGTQAAAPPGEPVASAVPAASAAPASSDAPAAVPAAPASAGARLAQARTAQSLSIEDVARQLKFAPRQIEALEAGRHEVLPGGVAVRGMVRSYARLLRIDATPLLEDLADRLAVPDADRLAARYGEPVPFSDGARRSTFVYVALSAAVLAVAALVLFEWRQDPPKAARMSFVPAAQAPLVSTQAPLVSTQAPLVSAQAPLASAQGSVQAQAAPAPAPGEARTTMASAGPAPASAAAADSGARAAPAGTHRIALRFERASWVEVRDGAGRVLMSKVNAPESEAVLEGEAPFTLVIGNAQYVRLRYDAKPIDLEPHIKVAVARLTLP